VLVKLNDAVFPALDKQVRVGPGGPDAAAAGPFGIVVVDPPYAEVDLLGAALDALAPVLAPGARVVAKHFWRDPPPAQVGLLASERERRFGETTLTFYRRAEDR
jgi:16S rRNA G966 N2-methylase RsmD